MQARKTFLIGLALAALSLGLVAGVGASGRTEPIAVFTNVNITKLRGDDSEATVAINPLNTQQVFTAVNRYTPRRSTDGGATWSKAGKGVGQSCCDNAAAWDDLGNLFLVNLNLTSSLDVNQAPLYVSTNGGKKFKQLLVLNSDPDVDQPTVKAGAGAVWATWNESGVIMARGAAVSGLGTVGPFNAAERLPGSGVAGRPFTRRLPGTRQIAPGSSIGQFGDIAIGPSGQVVVAYQDGDIGCPCSIYVNTDADGLGAGGFGSRVTAASTNVEKFDPITPQPNRTIDAEANLAYDRSGGTHDGRLYLVYTDENADESNNTQIKIRYSDDDGGTWNNGNAGNPINDDGTTRAQFLPYLAVDQTNGDLIVTWYDARNDPTNHDAIEYWGAVSEDGGATFDPNFQISAGSSNGDAGTDSGFEFGDYSWVDFHDGVAFPVWSDNSNSAGDNPDGTAGLDLYTSRIEVGYFCHGKHATIVGTSGDDNIPGTGGADVIVGLDGNDTIDGGGGNDTICGGDGNDAIVGGDGNELLDGGANDDTFDEGASASGSDVMIGGDGFDEVTYTNRTLGITARLDGEANDGEKDEEDNVSSDVEKITGGSGKDKLTGNDMANTLVGGAGPDSLRGRGGADTLNAVDGVSGNDSVDGGSDADTCTADAGDTVKNCP